MKNIIAQATAPDFSMLIFFAIVFLILYMVYSRYRKNEREKALEAIETEGQTTNRLLKKNNTLLLIIIAILAIPGIFQNLFHGTGH